MARTISQALRRAKAVKGQIAEVETRLQESTMWEDDDKPAFSYDDLVNEHGKLTKELVSLQTAIAIANATTTLPNGMTLSQAILELGQIKARKALHKRLRITQTTRDKKGTREEREYDVDIEKYVVKRTEYTTHVPLTVAEHAAVLKQLDDDFASLNDLVETANHETHI